MHACIAVYTLLIQLGVLYSQMCAFYTCMVSELLPVIYIVLALMSTW